MRLLEVEPDLGRFLRDEERAEIRGLTLPVVRVAKDGPDVAASLASTDAFGALVLDGMLLRRLRLGDHEAIQLLGPGDLVAVDEAQSTTLVTCSGHSAIGDTRLALLGHDFLSAARRWPGLIAGLHLRSAEQAERVSAQVVICQLPRVADRLLAMMWLLAESWGRVTPAGVTLPVVLTHEALGALIGARRPTVSLALAELMERGAVVRQRTGWLLLESLPETTVTDGQSEPPVLLDHEKSIWDSPSPPSPSPQELIGAEFLETLSRLRDQVGRVRAETDATLADVRSSRERTRVRRAQAAARSLSRRRAPSSG